MEIKTDITINCPSGFYCGKTGKLSKACSRCNMREYNEPYCELFHPFLDTDTNGNILKCEQCLLEERAARLKR